jgi:hypothetical protein
MRNLRTVYLSFLVALSMTSCVFNPSKSNPENKPSCGGTANGYFDVYYPGHNQSLKMQSLDSIMWTNLISPLPSYVTVSLYKNQSYVRTLASGVNNVGILSRISIPNIGTGSNYRIKVQNYSDSTKYDFGCNFNIYSDYNGSYNFTSPTASSACTTGKYLQIQWTVNGTPGNYVSLQLINGSDSSYIVSSSSSTSSGGSYNWYVPMGLEAKSTYRIKITSNYDPSISNLSPQFKIVGMAPDAYEPDNKRDSASVLKPLGTQQTHTLTLNDTDWVSFSLDSGTTYILQRSGAVALRVFMFFGSEATYSDVLYSTSTTASDLWVCPKTGTWYARISAALTSPTPGSYAFNILAYDSLALATVTSPAKNTTWAAGSSYQIQWIPDTAVLGTYVGLYLFKGSQQVLSIYSSLSNGGVYNWYIPSGLATGTDYRIKIINYANPTMVGFSNFFTISGVSADGFEPDNIRDMASTYASPQSHTLTLNDTDWVKFRADSGGIYLMQTYGTIATMVYLYSGTSTGYTTYFYTSSSSSPASLQWSCYKTGDYYARISAYSSSSYGGTYSFNVAKYDSLAMVTFASPTAGTTWAAGSSYQIRWIPDSSVLGTSVYLYLYKGSSQLMYIYGSSLSSSGVYTWTIPSGLSTGSDYRIKIVNYNNSIMGGFSSSFSISGAAPDAYEPDNQREIASTYSKSQSHTLSLNDTDWVKFKADSGGIYIMQTYGAPTYNYLYSGTSTSYLNYYYTSSSTSAAYLQWTCYKTDYYYVRISSYSSGTYGGSYTFTVAKSDSLAMATFTSPAAGATWAAGSSYQIQWVPDTAVLGTYVYLYLYKGSSQLMYIYSSSLSNSGVYTWTIPTGLSTGSDYRIKIVNYNNSMMGGFSQSFSISGAAPDAYEPDNIREQASTLSPLGKAQSHNFTMNDTDWVKFSLDSGKTYIMQSSPLTRVYVYYGSDVSTTTTFYSSSSSSSATRQYTSYKSGVYYGRITPYSSGSYGMTYSFVVTAYDSLNMISFTNPTAASVWSTGSTYRIQWSPDTVVLGTYVYLYLYKADRYIQYVYSSSLSNNGYYDWSVPTGLASGSDYRIKVLNGSNSVLGGYSPNFSISGITADAYEPDDSISKASSITPNSSAQSRTLTLYDIDWVGFTAQKDSIYVISASTSASGTLSTLYLYLYYSGGSSYISYQSGSSPKIIWTCTSSGTYYIRVSPYSSSYYGAYSLSVKKYSSTVGVTFVNPTAQSVWATGTPYSIQWIADTALFGTYVQLQLNVDTTYLQLITSSTQNTGAYSWTPTLGLGSGKKYTIRISSTSTTLLSGRSPAFTISGIDADAYEPDDTVSAAHTIATTGTPEIHTLPTLDKDWFSFSGSANYLYGIKTTGATRTTSTQIGLYGTDGRTLTTTANSSTTDSSATLLTFCSAAGTYYFKVTSSGYGTYFASVTSYDSTKFGLTVAAPKSGDSLVIGQVSSVSWSGQVAIGGSVDIYLFNSTGPVYNIAINTTNTGSYSWTVPTSITAGSDYYIKVISRVNSNIYGASGVFKIKAN